MADRYAVANGNWSNTATWNGGTLPGIGDDVRANNFTVTIDQDITVGSLRTLASAPAVSGGSFVISTIAGTRTINANLTAGGTTTKLVCQASSGNLVINGSVNGGGSSSAFGLNVSTSALTSLTINGDVSGGTGTSTHGVSVPLGGSITTLTISGNVNAGSGSTAYGVNMSSIVSSFNVTGNVASSNTSVALYFNGFQTNVTIGGNVTCGGSIGSITLANTLMAGSIISVSGDVSGSVSGSGAGFAISGVSISDIRIYIAGNLYGGSGGTGGSGGISLGAGARIYISGSVYAPVTALGSGIYTNGHQQIEIGGDLVGGSACGVQSSTVTTVLRVGGNLIWGPTGISPAQVTTLVHTPTTEQVDYVMRNAANTLVTLSNYPTGTPARDDVRLGVVYGADNQHVGTMVVPDPATVRSGVDVDATVGTALLDPIDIWNHLADDTVSGSIGKRVAASATVETTGAQIVAAADS